MWKDACLHVASGGNRLVFLEGRYYLELLFSLGVMWRGSIRVTTSNIRVKRSSDKEVMFEFPLFRVSYCGTDRRQKEVFSFVAKETDGR